MTRIGLAAAFACALMAVRAGAAAGQEPQALNLRALSAGPPPLPAPWTPYRPSPLPPVDLRNGSQLDARLQGDGLRLSLHEFLQLVVENDLDLLAARYNFGIAQVDILRAKSGQAARGLPVAPLPGGLFAGAIGAGVSTTAPLSPGGTGGAAISTQGKLVSFGARGIFDPTINVNVSYDHLTNPLNTTKVAGATSLVIPTVVLQSRFQQELPIGTSYSVSFNLQRQTSTQNGLLFNPAFSSFGALQVYQPLLSGLGLAFTQRFVTFAENNTKIVREAFHGLLNDRLSAAANAYWDLVALHERRTVAGEAVAAAERRHDEDLQRVDLDVMTPLDALVSESQLASARLDLVRADTAVRQQEVVVKHFVSKADEPRLTAIALEPTETLPGADDISIPAASTGITAALERRSSIRQAQLTVENQHVAEQFTKKNLLPVLSVYGALDVYGLSPATTPALRELLHSAYPEYSLGFTWSLPVLNRAAQADDVRARLEAQESEAALQRTRQQVTMQVENSTATIAQTRARVIAADRAFTASRAAYEGEQQRLDSGISTPYRVLLSQRDLESAQGDDIQARVNYAKALIAYEVAVGTLLERNGIDAEAAEHGTLWKSE